MQTPGSKAPARHWVVGNIKGSDLRTGDLSTATTVSAYKGPSPPWGSHRYGQFLFEQPSKLDYEILPSPSGIYNWDYAKWVEEYGLSGPVASRVSSVSIPSRATRDRALSQELPHDPAHGPALAPSQPHRTHIASILTTQRTDRPPRGS